MKITYYFIDFYLIDYIKIAVLYIVDTYYYWIDRQI